MSSPPVVRGVAVASSPPAPPMTFVQVAEFFGFAALIVVAVVFYLWWGFTFGVWIDNGLYAVVIVLVLFGVAGMWLVLPSPPPPPPP